MENSASNLSIKQALQAQSQQLLPIITQSLTTLHFSEVVHQRITQQNHEHTQNIENTYYQGLTRAQHPQFGSVMIKWQLSDAAYPIAFDLTHEADVLAAVNTSLKIKDNAIAIAPPLLAHHCVSVQVLEQLQQLVILVMPYYSNGSLAGQLSDRNQYSLTVQQKHHFLVQSAYLIANLHQASWLHNDIKPSNILLDGLLPNSADNSSVMPDLLLTDFALAQRCNAISVENPAGTPSYLAPERWQGQGATVKSDVYAFGIMMVEILMGVRPFQVSANSNDKLKAWAIQHCQQPIPKLSSEYSRYQCMVDKALAKRVERRYRSMEEVLEGLERL
ncbi:protein kinase [Psychrobacter sp. N25K4-3-2]|jgi:serine/threonine-protein kinase|uniref:serine/threonine protein kinase n=1 Tax=Psychrobacter TaxID=497 RepID=UPI00188A4D76|nr:MULTISPECIES: protein kinase [Psychrobacter]MBF4488878.1 protein kinase [Psychrobacter sp. N25K4-3-2]MCH1781722.1 protein kinase [Psychrobacter glaciei]